MESLWSRDVRSALQRLADPALWLGASPALEGLRRMRWAEALTSCGDHAKARGLISELAYAASGDVVERVLIAHTTVTAQRQRYAEDPVGNYQDVLRSFEYEIALPSSPVWRAPDAAALAERLQLHALCLRRSIESAEGGGSTTTVAGLLRDCTLMQQCFHAAYLLFFIARGYDRAQHVCANLAYAHQQMAQCLGGDHVVRALEWHRLSFGLHTAFGGGENSAWEYIFLGELWLQSEEARTLLGQDRLRVGWECGIPDERHFYEHVCTVAAQTCDPRQFAYAQQIRYRFALQARDGRWLRQVTGEFASWLNGQPAMRSLMQAEGYELPGAVRSRC